MIEELLADIRKHYSAALDAKPGKGEYTEKGIDALTDSVCDIPVLLRALEAALDVTEADLRHVHQGDPDLSADEAFVAGGRHVQTVALSGARGYSWAILWSQLK